MVPEKGHATAVEFTRTEDIKRAMAFHTVIQAVVPHIQSDVQGESKTCTSLGYCRDDVLTKHLCDFARWPVTLGSPTPEQQRNEILANSPKWLALISSRFE